MLSPTDRTHLVAIARAAVVARVAGAEPPGLDAVTGPLAEPGAAFVTLRFGGRLRGCVGSITPSVPLAEAVAHAAAASATEDPRFDSVGESDLASLELEISVLGELEPIDGPADIEIGRHGLVVEDGAAHGLLLPQVAVEWNWSDATFVNQVCIKAGLATDAWRGDARLFRFEADVFGEG